MRLFTPDLYRLFALGFLLGTVAAGAAAVKPWDGDLTAQAQAAVVIEPSSEFLIEVDQ